MNSQVEDQDILSFEAETKPLSDIGIVGVVKPERYLFWGAIDESVKYYTITALAGTSGQPLWKGFTHGHLIAHASAFGSTHAVPDLLARSRLVKTILNPAIDKMKGFSNAALISDVRVILDKLYNALMRHEVKNCEPLRAFESEDCILLEWIYPHWRIGFATDPNPKDSSWFLVSDDSAGGINASGSLLSADIDWIVNWLIRRNY